LTSNNEEYLKSVRFVSTIFNKGAYLTFKALKVGIIAICYLRKSLCFPFNVEWEPLVPFF